MEEKNNFVSVRIKGIREGKIKGQKKHDFREGYIPGYVDQEKRGVDTIYKFFGSVEDFVDLQKKTYSEKTGRKYRKDGRLGISGILTFGRDVEFGTEPVWDPKLCTYISAEKFADKLAKKTVSRIAQKLGQDVYYIVRHSDESKIHYHFMLTYVDPVSGNTAAKLLTPCVLSSLQDVAGEVWQEAGLRRGMRKAERIRAWEKGEVKELNIRHKSVREMHKTLEEDISKLEQDLDSRTKEVQAVLEFAKTGKILEIEEEDSPEIKSIKRQINRYIRASARVQNELAEHERKYRSLEEQERLLKQKIEYYQQHNVNIKKIIEEIKRQEEKKQEQKNVENENKKTWKDFLGIEKDKKQKQKWDLGL